MKILTSFINLIALIMSFIPCIVCFIGAIILAYNGYACFWMFLITGLFSYPRRINFNNTETNNYKMPTDNE